MGDYFRNYNRPEVIIYDHGTSFTSQEFRNFIKENDVKHILIAMGSPQVNGQVERVKRGGFAAGRACSKVSQVG